MSITNELLAHMSYHEAVQKNIVREQWETDVEKFLATGGKIKTLEQGFTHFRDGIVPVSTRPQMSAQERKEKDEAIAKKNLEIQQYKQALKDQKAAQTKANLKARLKEQSDLLRPFFKSVSKADIERIANAVGYQLKHLQNGGRGNVRFSDEKWDLIKKEVNAFLGGGV